jgi:hypothetical protein
MTDRCAHHCCDGARAEGHMHLFGPDECLACRGITDRESALHYDVPLMVIINGIGSTYTDACAHAITQAKLAGFDVLEQQVPVINPTPVDKGGD